MFEYKKYTFLKTKMKCWNNNNCGNLCTNKIPRGSTPWCIDCFKFVRNSDLFGKETCDYCIRLGNNCSNPKSSIPHVSLDKYPSNNQNSEYYNDKIYTDEHNYFDRFGFDKNNNFNIKNHFNKISSMENIDFNKNYFNESKFKKNYNNKHSYFNRFNFKDNNYYRNNWNKNNYNWNKNNYNWNKNNYNNNQENNYENNNIFVNQTNDVNNKNNKNNTDVKSMLYYDGVNYILVVQYILYSFRGIYIKTIWNKYNQDITSESNAYNQSIVSESSSTIDFFPINNYQYGNDM